MENDSLAELKSLIEEEIYLIPEDREAILSQLEASAAGLSGPSPNRDMHPAVAVFPKQSEPEPQSPEEEPVQEPISVRGNFSKGVLILHEEATLKPELLEMLVKMLNACGHSMSEVGLLASGDLEGRSLEEFRDLNAHTVLKFGRISHPVNAIPARPYEVYSESETEFLFADALGIIAEDISLKKKLWTSLQVLFNLT